MVLKPHKYEPDFEDSAARPRHASLDLLRLETEADHLRAKVLVQQIMDRYSLTVDMIESELEVGGKDWAKAGDTTIDLSFLPMPVWRVHYAIVLIWLLP